jgi:hypothetical protein
MIGFDVEFQIRIRADLEKERIFVEADQWTEGNPTSKEFELDFYYGNSHQW